MKRRGTTLAELMLTVAIVGIFAGAMLSSVSRSQSRSVISSEKRIILDAAQDEMDTLRGLGKSGSLVAGNSVVPKTLGLPYPVVFRRFVTADATDYRLFTVKVRASWDDGTSDRKGEIELDSKVFNEP